MVFSEFMVEHSPGELRVTARGERLSPERHSIRREVKAVTYHDLEVTDTSARVLLDI